MSLATKIAGESGLDDAYEQHVQDAQRHLETHCCSAEVLSLESLGIPAPPYHIHTGQQSVPDLPLHSIQEGDRFLSQLLVMLRTFLTNNTELNLSLTETIFTLLSCPKVHLEGWTAVDPKHYTFPRGDLTG